MFCYFAFFRASVGADCAPGEDALRELLLGLQAIPGVERALVHRAATDARHPFPDDEAPPALALQLYARELVRLEQILLPAGELQALLHRLCLADGLQLVQQQVMLARRFPAQPHEPRANTASYLVHYPGRAEDLNAWLAYYLSHHPQIMRSFPGIREIEIYTRVDWIGGLPGPRVEHMQRNKLVFADSEALGTSLTSPVIKTMRADYARFPPFSGGNVHYAMHTLEAPTPTLPQRGRELS
jgi:hypothetical protein